MRAARFVAVTVLVAFLAFLILQTLVAIKIRGQSIRHRMMGLDPAPIVLGWTASCRTT